MLGFEAQHRGESGNCLYHSKAFIANCKYRMQSKWSKLDMTFVIRKIKYQVLIPEWNDSPINDINGSHYHLSSSLFFAKHKFIACAAVSLAFV